MTCRLELADQIGEPLDRGRVHHERVVTEIEAAKAGTERSCSSLGFCVTDLLHPRLGLPVLLPQLARLAALTVRERDDLRRPAPGDDGRDRARGTPDEVGGMGADDEESSRHRPAFVVFTTAIVRISSSREPGPEKRVGHQREPVLDRWVRHLAEIGRKDVARRACRADRRERLLPRHLAGVDRREAALEHRASSASSRCSAIGTPWVG